MNKENYAESVRKETLQKIQESQSEFIQFYTDSTSSELEKAARLTHEVFLHHKLLVFYLEVICASKEPNNKNLREVLMVLELLNNCFDLFKNASQE